MAHNSDSAVRLGRCSKPPIQSHARGQHGQRVRPDLTVAGTPNALDCRFEVKSPAIPWPEVLVPSAHHANERLLHVDPSTWQPISAGSSES